MVIVGLLDDGWVVDLSLVEGVLVVVFVVVGVEILVSVLAVVGELEVLLIGLVAEVFCASGLVATADTVLTGALLWLLKTNKAVSPMAITTATMITTSMIVKPLLFFFI